MTDLDLSKYEGHTPGPWECDPNDVTWIRTESEPYGPFGKMHVADLRGWGYLTGVGACGMDPPDAEPIHNANARLIADAPLLLAEVKRLDLEHKAAERELLWVRQSHARLLEAIKADAYRIMRDGSLCWCEPTSDPHEWWCVDIRAAVAEAEALNGE